MNIWDTFIAKGFEKPTEVASADKFLRTYKPTNEFAKDDLHIRWRKNNGIKEFVLCCTCGNSRMTVHEQGIRCQMCGRFHSHEDFLKKKKELESKARIDDGVKEIIPQPYQKALNFYNTYVRRLQKEKRGTKGTGISKKAHRRFNGAVGVSLWEKFISAGER